MATVTVTLLCADTGQADQVAAAIRDAGEVHYTAQMSDGPATVEYPVVLQVTGITVDAS
jgi:hypothetical protein